MSFLAKSLNCGPPEERQQFESTGLNEAEIQRGIAALDLLLQSGQIGGTLAYELELIEPLPKSSALTMRDIQHGDELTKLAVKYLGINEDYASDAVFEHLTDRHRYRERLAAIERAAEKVAKRITRRVAS